MRRLKINFNIRPNVRFNLRLNIFLTIFAAFVFSLFALTLAKRSYNFQGFKAELSAVPAYTGSSEIQVPPLGEISAQTHRVPLKVQLALKKVDPAELQPLIAMETREAYFDQVLRQLKRAAADFMVRGTIFSIAGGLLGAVLVTRNRKRILLGAGVGAFVGVALLGGTYKDFKTEALSQPTFNGVLKAAPWLLGEAEDRWSTLEEYRDEIKTISTNLAGFYNRVEGWEPLKLQEGKTKILHVSDIHNNPAAYDLISEISRTFKVDAVMDSGDITDFGTPIEGALLKRIGKMQVPYFWVAGNHDSPEVKKLMQTLPNTRYLNGPLEWRGLQLWGASHPSSTASMYNNSDPALVSGEEKDLRRKLRGKKPFILLVHERSLAKKMAGSAKLILAGHSHRMISKKIRGSIILDAGTTGGAGMRNFEEKKGVPLTLQLLHIDKKKQKLTAVDQIVIDGETREFTLKRILFDEDEITQNTALAAPKDPSTAKLP